MIIFASKALFPKLIHQTLFTSFSVYRVMNPIVGNMSDFAVKISEHFGISYLSNETVQPRNDRSVCHLF